MKKSFSYKDATVDITLIQNPDTKGWYAHVSISDDRNSHTKYHGFTGTVEFTEESEALKYYNREAAKAIDGQ